MKLFLSYAHEDIVQVRQLYEILNAIPSVDVWFDKESILPGRVWRKETKDAIKNADYFLLILSKKSTTKRGFFQKEIREAISAYEEMPPNSTYLIPVRIEECDIHFEQLRKLQYVDLFPDWRVGVNKLIKSLETHRRDEYNPNNISIRFRTHQACFQRNLKRILYFVTITNTYNSPIVVTHVWYEDIYGTINITHPSRLLPVHLLPMEIWETWIDLLMIPEEFRHNAYENFRLRISTGDVFMSHKDETVPERGKVPGGNIDLSDIL